MSALAVLVHAGYEAETVAQADRGLKDALGPLAYVVSGTAY
jgi:diacylglycerol kinase family enzyme